MKITVDNNVCTGHARCNAAAPELYDLDDNGFSAITTLDVPQGLEAAARLGADSCPERAISLSE